MIGDYWTSRKLERLDAYFPFFLDATRERYRTIYVDAFASTGKVKLRRPKGCSRVGLFTPTNPFIDGSARRSLQVERPFGRYYFVDIEGWKCQRLEQLRSEFPALDARIQVQCKDATKFLRQFCRRMDTQSSRALVFLDAPGTVVGWDTIKAIAETGAVDLWALFPLGIAVNRLLKRRGDDIGQTAKNTLSYIFGNTEWEEDFYRAKRRQGLFRDTVATMKVADFNTIMEFFLGRLKTVFPHVSNKTLSLENRRGNPMFTLCFASADPDAGDRLAIAEAILSLPSSAHPFSSRLREILARKQRDKAKDGPLATSS
jgi:three-Cys-motif partner protein